MAIGTISAEFGNIPGNFALKNVLRANTAANTSSMPSSTDNSFSTVSVSLVGLGAKQLGIPLHDLASSYGDDSRYITAKKQSLKTQSDMALRQNAILNAGRWDTALAGSNAERVYAGIKAARSLEGEKGQAVYEHNGEILDSIKDDIEQHAEEALSSDVVEYAAAENIQDSEGAAMHSTAETPDGEADSPPQILTARAQSYLVAGAAATFADTSANTAESGLHAWA